MKGFDKFLIGIVLGVVLLVAAVFVLMFVSREPEYQLNNNPEAVVHNYLLALQKEDYQHAYIYLSTTLPGYPSNADLFQRSVESNSYRFRMRIDATLVVEGSDVSGVKAQVHVRETRFSQNEWIPGGQGDRNIEFDLAREGEDWKIVDASSYFAYCWRNAGICP